MTRHGLSFLPFANLLLGGIVVAACSPFSGPSMEMNADADTDTDADPDAMVGTDAADPAGDDRDAGSDDDHGDGSAADETGSTGSDADDDTAGGDDPTGSADACDLVTHECVAPAPEGWSGPIIRREIDPHIDAGCPDEFNGIAIELHRELVDTEHSCDCECGSAVNVECQGSATVQYKPYGQIWTGNTWQPVPAGCSGGSVTTVSSNIAALGEFGSGSHSFQSTLLNLEVVGGYCTEIEGSTFAEPHFTTRALGCEPEAPIPGVCEGADLCVPKHSSPFDLGMCIFAEGDLECPAEGPYVERTVYHAGLEDTRACGACNCGAPSGTCEGATMQIGQFAIFGISPSITIPATSGCVPWTTNANITAMALDPGTPDADCNVLAGGGDELGAVTPVGATTMCCVAG